MSVLKDGYSEYNITFDPQAFFDNLRERFPDHNIVTKWGTFAQQVVQNSIISNSASKRERINQNKNNGSRVVSLFAELNVACKVQSSSNTIFLESLLKLAEANASCDSNIISLYDTVCDVQHSNISSFSHEQEAFSSENCFQVRHNDVPVDNKSQHAPTCLCPNVQSTPVAFKREQSSKTFKYGSRVVSLFAELDVACRVQPSSNTIFLESLLELAADKSSCDPNIISLYDTVCDVQHSNLSSFSHVHFSSLCKIRHCPEQRCLDNGSGRKA